jgi:hypothetical protein
MHGCMRASNLKPQQSLTVWSTLQQCLMSVNDDFDSSSSALDDFDPSSSALAAGYM